MTTTANQSNAASPTLRDWHKKTNIQNFVVALAAGEILNEDGKFEVMSREVSEIVLSHIDNEGKFIDMVKEYAPEYELEAGYEVYTVENESLYIENSEALLDFANPAWVKSNSDIVEALYDSIAYYGIGDITHSDINSAFFEGERVTDEENDAWHMGIKAITNKALHRLLVAYAVYTGITVIQPVPIKKARVKNAFKVNEGSCGSVDVELISEKLTHGSELQDTEVVIGGQVLFVMEGSRIEEFKDDFQKLSEKYRI